MFHMPPPPSRSTDKAASNEVVHFRLEKSEVDFAVGAGAWIVDVDVALQWAEDVEGEPPKRQTSADSVQGIGGEPRMPGGFVGDIARIIQGVDVENAVKEGEAEAD